MMDIQIDLRRPDFEAMHPTAKLFGFNEEAKMYFGELDSSTNKQWTTWCACLGMLHLEAGQSKEVPEWIDYTKQSPHMNGRYQVFISGEQLAADWESPYGFSDPIDCCALIQEYISHWALLPEPPKTLEQKG